MTLQKSRSGLTRRQLLSRSIAAGAAFVVGSGFIAGSDAAWALETTALKPETMATLVQMARDIYPHDHVPTEFYVIAVKGYDTPEAAAGWGLNLIIDAAWFPGLLVFVIGWIIQFVGHIYEGRKPAFVDDVVGLLVGPMFVVGEVLMMAGMLRSMHSLIEAQAGATR